MTQKERLEALEAQVAALQTRLAAIEARPAYYPYPYWQVGPTTGYPKVWWQTTTSGNEDTFSSGGPTV